MGKTNIQWTDMSWNPVTGCTKVSTGCKYCYAERLFPRVYGRDMVPIENPAVALANEETDRPREFTDVWLHPDRLEHPLHWKKPRMIFVNSMSDLFHEDVPFEFIARIFDTMQQCPQHTFQILTKRPNRMYDYCIQHPVHAMENVWLGISCENQATADERIPILLQTPAAVRFLSCEPLLDRIDIRGFLGDYYSWEVSGKGPFVDWVIVGGESGPGYRPMKPEWAKSIIEQCQAARVPVFMKQMAGKKEIPEDLKIREFPK